MLLPAEEAAEETIQTALVLAPAAVAAALSW